MIAALLKAFPAEFGLDVDKIVVPSHVENADFVLTDTKACQDCQANPMRSDRQNCNKEMLRINTDNQDVLVIEFEKYMEQFNTTLLKDTPRCDYIILDNDHAHNKIAFCDLTCTEETWMNPNTGKYKEGKRAYAINQMLLSVNSLLSDDMLSVSILTFPEKICLLGWRDYNSPDLPVSPVRGNARRNMQAFATTPSSMAHQTTREQQILVHKFRFVQVKYPSAYKW